MKKKILFLSLLMSFSLVSYGQDDDLPPDPDEPDVPPAPINQSLPALLILGVSYSAWILVRKSKRDLQ